MSYFKHYPTTKYAGYDILDLTRRVKLENIVGSGALDYMSYTVAEGEKPEDVAFYYYDDPSLAWLVLLSNDIVDAFTEWPKSEANLQRHIQTKYASQAGATGQAVTDWTKNETITSNIIHYQSQFDEDIRINRASFVAYGNSWTHPIDKMVVGEEYTINEIGDVAISTWQAITGAQNIFEGQTFIAQQSGENVLFSDTTSVTGSSATNPAREFYPVRAYDYEFNLNEERRDIQLINKGYVPTILDQLETILKDG